MILPVLVVLLPELEGYSHGATSRYVPEVPDRGCYCESYDCAGECCGVGACSCTTDPQPPPDPMPGPEPWK